MARRDAFTGLRDPNPMIEVEEDQQQESTMIPRQPLDLIPTADLRKKDHVSGNRNIGSKLRRTGEFLGRLWSWL